MRKLVRTLWKLPCLIWLDALGTVGPIREVNLSTFLGVSWGVDDCSLWSPVGPCPIGPCPIHRKMREVQLAAGGRQVAPTFPLSVPIQTLPIQTVPIQTLPIQTLPIQTLPGWGGVGGRQPPPPKPKPPLWQTPPLAQLEYCTLHPPWRPQAVAPQ